MLLRLSLLAAATAAAAAAPAAAVQTYDVLVYSANAAGVAAAVTASSDNRHTIKV
eukprot:COSAG01_NODE_45318_length_410_cov_1.151125_1_plen_54_part_01